MSEPQPAHFRRVAGGVELFVRLTPRGGADALGRVERTADGRAHIAARVRAAPEKGEANAALATLVARALGVAKGEVEIVSGATARLKTLRIAGDPAALSARLDELQKGGGSS